MERSELVEYIEEFRDSNTEMELLEVLKDELVKELENFEVSQERQKHDLNLLIRDLGEELNYVESEKLSEFEPEEQ